MILQALEHYYHRSREAGIGLPDYGWELVPIEFVIVVDPAGQFVTLEDYRQQQGKRLVGKPVSVPQAVKRSSGVAANLLWDKIDYLLGYDRKGKPERARQQYEAFIAAIEQRCAIDLPVVAAVLGFLRSEPQALELVQSHPLWDELEASTGYVTFRIEGMHELVPENLALRQSIENSATQSEAQIQGLLAGELVVPANLHPSIKGVRDARPGGAKLVSFNEEAFTSYGKKQGANAPLGEKTVFNYSTALNHLLSRSSRQKLNLGEATVTFWAAEAAALEDDIPNIFGDNFATADDPQENTEHLRATYLGAQQGAKPYAGDNTEFYVLALSPNVARISVRYWLRSTVADIAANITAYFSDIEIVAPPRAQTPPKLSQLLRTLAAQGKWDNLPPNLTSDVLRAVLEGGDYPLQILQLAIRRIRAERRIPYERAALIRAVLKRNRISKNLEVPTVALDLNNKEPGYRLGRLFAALEQLQSAANPGLNTTIADSYFGTASSVPGTVFSRLMRLRNHHMSKLRKARPGQATNLDKLISEILEAVSAFPMRLSMAQQGLFAIGYYHQRQDLFTKKTSTTEQEASKGATE